MGSHSPTLLSLHQTRGYLQLRLASTDPSNTWMFTVAAVDAPSKIILETFLPPGLCLRPFDVLLGRGNCNEYEGLHVTQLRRVPKRVTRGLDSVSEHYSLCSRFQSELQSEPVDDSSVHRD
jgi:hypothetical protein